MTTTAADTSLSFDHRRGSVTATVVNSHGALAAHTDVLVEQTSHAFGFGNIGFDLLDFANAKADDAALGSGGEGFGGDGNVRPMRHSGIADDWLDLFNTVTLPFYWSSFEARRGEPDTARLLGAARWFASHGIVVKGHPLLWHTLAPEWLMGLPDEEVESLVRARIVRDVSDFAGVIDLWDAINEPVIMPVFTAQDNAITRLAQAKGRVEMARIAFESARAANPTARLVINDFDLSPDYERVISDCLDAGIVIDAIGLQTHMHQGYRGEQEVWETLERFARFGIPLQMTETSLVSGDLMPADIVDLNDYVRDDWPSTTAGEDRQADEVVRHYRTLFAHPAVESVTYWGLSDNDAWLGAPTGLVRRDGTHKPSYWALHDLIKGQWWHSSTSMRTDEAGRVRIEGFAGTYTISHAGGRSEVTVTAGRDHHTRLVLES